MNSCCSPPFTTRQLHFARRSIRELLKVVYHVRWFFEKHEWTSRNLSRCQELASSVCWAVYGSRFRHGGRDVVQGLIQDIRWPVNHNTPVSWSLEPGRVVVGSVSAPRGTPDDFGTARAIAARLKSTVAAGTSAGDLSDARLRLVSEVHAAARGVLMNHDFVARFGL